MKIKQIILLLTMVIGLMSGVFAQPILAQETTENPIKEEILEGKIERIVDFGKESYLETMVPFQELEIEVTSGSLAGEKIRIKNSGVVGELSQINYQEYDTGDKLKIYYSADYEGNPVYAIQGRVKRDGLTALVIIFVLSVLAVGRLWGALSLVGMGISFLVIFKLIVPLIIRGVNPVLAAVLGSLIIIPSTFYVSHGFNLKTHVGVISTTIALIFTGMLAVVFVEAVHLTGYASEEAGFLQVERQGSIDIRGLLIAGIIIGTLGILDDVTVGQSSVVQQIRLANPKMKMWELFKKGMKVGQDHISSMVNTLVLVYAGSALPLILLFFDDEISFGNIIEFELIAEEIVRMMVGSIGLVLVAPLATLLAAFLFSREKSNS